MPEFDSDALSPEEQAELEQDLARARVSAAAYIAKCNAEADAATDQEMLDDLNMRRSWYGNSPLTMQEFLSP